MLNNYLEKGHAKGGLTDPPLACFKFFNGLPGRIEETKMGNDIKKFSFREATLDELITRCQFGYPVTFRHFTMEMNNPRARNGVSHRQYSRSTLRLVNGKPSVRHHGKMVEVTGTLYTLEDGRQFVGLLRVKSEYLPSV